MSSVAKRTVNKLRMLTVGIATTVLVGSGLSASYADSTPAPDCTIDAGKTCQLVFTDTSRVSTWTVPSWVTSIDLTIQGGVGGPGGSSVPSLSPVVDPFFAQVVSGTLSVTSGSTLEIALGSGGGLDPSGIANAGINPMSDYDGGAGIDRVVGGGGAASVVSVDGSTYVVGGTAGASRRFAKHAPNGTSSNGADAIGIPGYKQVMQYFGGGGGGQVGGQAGTPGSSQIAGLAERIGMEYVDAGSDGMVTISYAAPTTPTAPIIQDITEGNQSLSLDVAPGEDWAGPATSNYEYTLDNGATWTAIRPAQTSGPLSISGLTNGASYAVKIRAVNSVGAGPESNLMLGSPFTSPSAPIATPHAVMNGGVDIDFTVPSDNGGRNITNYEYSIDGGAHWVASTPAKTTSPVNIAGLTAGQSYQVGLRAVNDAGSGAASTFIAVTAIGGASAPSLTSVTPSNQQLSVAFTAPSKNGSSAITNYEYSINGGSTWSAVSPATATSPIVISGLTNGTTYSVKLRAVNAGGLGAASTALSGTPVTTPGAPSISSVTSDSQKLYISFGAPASNGGSAITNYEYSTNDGSSWTTLSPAQTSGIITVSGLTVGTAYPVRVRAVNSAGSGAASAQVTAIVITTASAPTITGVTENSGSVSVGFSAPSDNGSSSISNYEYSTNGGSSWTRFTPAVTSDATPVVISGLSNGTTYSIGLRAVNGSGSGAASGFVSAKPFTAPSAPSLVSITPGDAQITLSFAAPASNGGSSLTDFQYTLNDGANWTSAGLTSPLTLAGLQNGQSYSIKLRAVNARGFSLASSSLASTPRTVPSAPTVASTSSSNGSVSVTVTNPVSDGGSSITNFEFSTDGSSWTSLNPAVTAGNGSSVFSINGLTVGTAYVLQVRAVNVAGAGSASAAVTVTPISGASAPVISGIVAGNAKVTVTFAAPVNDGHSPITNYEYSVNGGASWSLVAPSSTASPITLTGLANGAVYSVKLRAVNAGGIGTASNAVAVTPFDVPGQPNVISVSSGDKTLTYQVSAPSSNGGSPVTGYEYTIDGGNTWTTVGADISAGITLSSLTNGTSYSFEIRAINIAGKGLRSSALTGTPAKLPSAPIVESIVAGNGKLTFKLSSILDNGSADITGVDYKVGTDAWQSLAFTTLTSPYTISGLNNAQKYDIYVRVVNRIGAGPSSLVGQGTPAVQSPSAPTLGSVVPDNGRLVIALSTPADNGGAVITSYEYSIDAGSSWVTASSVGSSLIVNQLTNGTSYSVIARAVNSIGKGAASNVVTGTPITTVPGAPVIASITGQANQLDVNYQLANDGGLPILGYEYSLNGGSTWKPAHQDTTVTKRLNLTGLVAGTNYIVQIRATNALGAGDSSEMLVARAGSGATPLVVTAVAPVAGAIDVTFVTPANNKQGAWANGWYQYSSDGGATWSKAVRSIVTPGLQSAGKAYVHIGDLVNGRAYAVAVRAMYTQGLGIRAISAPGLRSAVMTGTPRTVATAPRITTITTSGGSITIIFEAPKDNGGAAITNYAYSFGGSTWKAANPKTALGPIIISQLKPGMTYTVRLRAINAAGAGLASGIAAIVVKR